MRIGNREIGPGHPPYVVAELSGEHLGKLDNAFTLIRAAKEAGADAVKLQCFDPHRLANARGGFNKAIEDGIWKGLTLGFLYQRTHTPREWFPDLMIYAMTVGITLFSSVFDEDDVDFLETLGCPAYKIASAEITCLPLVRKAAATGKPLIISTGMASNEDARAAYEAAGGPSSNVAMLHCVSAYPCPIGDAHLLHIRSGMPFPAMMGFSDHTLGSTAAIVATALGASIIEKHIMLWTGGGPDAAFSLDPGEFKEFVQDVKDAYASLGTGERPASEAPYLDLRRK